MTDETTRSTAEIATADVKRKSKGISVVWVIPVIAALIGGWMVFQNLLEEKPVVTVTFKNAAGLVAGKTLVKYRDIVVGKVTEMKFTKGLGEIEVVLQFDDVDAKEITAKTRFWVVKPRVGLGGVAGLDTLLSGAYIEVDPSLEGGPATTFTGLEEPGLHQLGNPGTRYNLQAYRLGSVSRGSPVRYRDLDVGLVSRHGLAEDNSAVEIEVFIRAPYDKLVTKDTRFWNISGLEIDAGATGFELKLASVATLIGGGIAFSNGGESTAAQAPPNSVFNLYESEDDEIIAAEVAFSVPMKLYFDDVQGLEEGAPATYKGLRIGTIDQVSIEEDDDNQVMLTFAMLKIEPDRLPGKLSNRFDSDDKRTKGVHRFFEALATRGVRAQLKTGNLLTGKALVLFDDSRQVEPASVEYVDGVAVFPTIPQESFEAIIAKVDSILAKIDAIPIEKIGSNLAQTSSNLAQTTTSVNEVPIAEIGDNLAALTAKLDKLPVGQIGKDLAETLASLEALIETLNAAKGGVLGVQTHKALTEIGRAATALRGMAEYLERHPEALLKGKK
ncbi:MAG: MlaD family protein [Gammaproteobacteria bacterium]